MMMTAFWIDVEFWKKVEVKIKNSKGD
jgi:hypothetical protein